MKKGMMLLAVLLLGAFAFAQEGNVQAYERAANQVKRLQKADLPSTFYYSTDETQMSARQKENLIDYQLRVNLYDVIYTTYVSNPKSYHAAFNYANAMVQPEYEVEGPGDRMFPTHQRSSNKFVIYNADNAIKALKPWLKEKANDLQMQQILWTAYEYKMFGNTRAGGLYSLYPIYYVNGELVDAVLGEDLKHSDHVTIIHGMRYDDIVKVYEADFPAAKARLRAFQNRVRLADTTLDMFDYKEAALICVALNRPEQAQEYFQQAISMGLLENGTEDGQFEIASSKVLKRLGAAEILEPIYSERAAELGRQALSNTFSGSAMDNMSRSSKPASLYSKMLEAMNKGR